ncbi:hypothetical protein GEW_00645 [Pasteurella multocida subsp. gallicida str. Anand1_poultry]|nr:hypothetical protein GEW_00645 [Pasteurella multocida subsp. gallicida str. Anand1_poultry]
MPQFAEIYANPTFYLSFTVLLLNVSARVTWLCLF